MRLAPIALLFCTACASLPPHVADRPLRSGSDPIGVWTLTGGETRMTIKAPREPDAQLWDVEVKGADGVAVPGKALSDGEWLYVVQPVWPGSRIALGSFGRTANGVEGMLGLYRLGWEGWSSKAPGEKFSGSWSVRGLNPRAKGYESDLVVRAVDGVSDAYALAWTRGESQFEGVGLEAGDRMVMARWGRKVISHGISGSGGGDITFTTTTETRDRARVVLSAFRVSGDQLEGRSMNGDSAKITAEVYQRAR